VRRIFAAAPVDDKLIVLAVARLGRVREIQRVLIQQIAILETMTASSFLEFRDFLVRWLAGSSGREGARATRTPARVSLRLRARVHAHTDPIEPAPSPPATQPAAPPLPQYPASGFQSVQFRLIENRLGLRADARLAYGQRGYCSYLQDGGPQSDAAAVRASEREASLFDLVEAWLERTPFVGVDADEEAAARVDAGAGVSAGTGAGAADAETGFAAPPRWSWWAHYRAAVSRMLAADEEAFLSSPRVSGAEREAALRDLAAAREHFATVLDAERHAAAREQGLRRLSHRALQAALLITLYADEPILQLPNQLLASLVDVDAQLTAWRHRHALMVHRMIGQCERASEGARERGSVGVWERESKGERGRERAPARPLYAPPFPPLLYAPRASLCSPRAHSVPAFFPPPTHAAGTKLGTGGSTGYHYLRATAERHKIFGDIAGLATYLVPRHMMPPLPPQVRAQLAFAFVPSAPTKEAAVRANEDAASASASASVSRAASGVDGGAASPARPSAASLRALSGVGSVAGGVGGGATECPMGFGAGERGNPHY
jgi:tryptophan 2,3-dioxygenase